MGTCASRIADLDYADKESRGLSSICEDGSVSEYHSNMDSNGFDPLRHIHKRRVDDIIARGLVAKPFSPYAIAVVYFLQTPIAFTFLKRAARARRKEKLLTCWADLMSVKDSDESDDIKSSFLIQLFIKYSSEESVKFSLTRKALVPAQVPAESTDIITADVGSSSCSEAHAAQLQAPPGQSTSGVMGKALTDIKVDSSTLVSESENCSRVTSALNRLLQDIASQVFLEVITPSGTAAAPVEEVMIKMLQAVSLKKHFDASVASFSFEKVLGEGSFGMVVLCRKNNTGIKYAMKLQEKEEMLANLEEDPDADLCGEVQVLQKCDHPFISKLCCSFQTPKLCIMVMEYAEYGDLNYFMKARNLNCLPLGTARFYLSELVSAVRYLHKQGFMHRDIKPGNILVRKSGHLALTDFGSALEIKTFARKMSIDDESRFLINLRKRRRATKSIIPDLHSFLPGPSSVDSAERGSDRDPHQWQASTIAGTDAYMSPEIRYLMSLQSKDKQNAAYYYYYTQAVDWWSVGATAFKIIMGSHAITKGTMKSIVDEYEYVGGAGDYSEALQSYGSLEPPGGFSEEIKCQMIPCPASLSAALPSPEATSFVSGLLDVNFITRLGSGANGSRNLRRHPFFKGINWEELGESSPPIDLSNSVSRNNATGSSFEGKWAHRLLKFTSGTAPTKEENFNLNFEKIMLDVGRQNWLPEGVQKLASISMGKSFHSVSERNQMFKKWDLVSEDIIYDEVGLSKYLPKF